MGFIWIASTHSTTTTATCHILPPRWSPLYRALPKPLAASSRNLIVPQNSEELLLRNGYVDVIDAIANEDLLHGSPTEGEPNSNGQIINSVGWLGVAHR
jgi:hypothetical protein